MSNEESEGESGAVAVETVRAIIERTVAAMGYELVDLEMAQNGLLRAYIDSAAGIRIEDCEAASRQLTHVLTVEEVEYSRLEVSSPGVDRPLNKPADFVRFAGSEVAIRLKRPFEGRRNFDGVLTVEPDGRFGLELISDEQRQAQAARGRNPARAGARKAAKAPVVPKGEPQAHAQRKLVFALDEIDRARLVPNLKF